VAENAEGNADDSRVGNRGRISAGTVAVVGGGIVGVATALALAGRGFTPIVLEAEARLASHQTGHNSGVIHSGLYYKPGSLRATLCRSGLERMYGFCEEHNIPHRRCGKVVVAVNESELPRLYALEERGRANGLQLQRLDAGQLREFEPNVSGLAGLWVADTGVVNYATVTEAMASQLVRLGGEVRAGHRVTAITEAGSEILVGTHRGTVRCNLLVNCAGLQADRVAQLAGAATDIRVVPFRGEYYTLRPESSHLVRGLIYPVPNPALPFLGVHFTRGVDDVVEAGPNAVLAMKREGYSWSDVSLVDMANYAFFPGFWKMISHHFRHGVMEVRRSLSRKRFLTSLQTLIPSLTDDDIQVGGSGVRAMAVGRGGQLIDDFHIVEHNGQVHVLNAPSPAATASLAIGDHVAERVLQLS
jgi:L-2-hydroxyglutarate oxidase